MTCSLEDLAFMEAEFVRQATVMQIRRLAVLMEVASAPLFREISSSEEDHFPPQPRTLSEIARCTGNGFFWPRTRTRTSTDAATIPVASATEPDTLTLAE